MQEPGIDFQKVFAPVARYKAIRTLLAASMSDEMYVYQMNIGYWILYRLAYRAKYIWSSQKCWYKINKKIKFINCLSHYID